MAEKLASDPLWPRAGQWLMTPAPGDPRVCAIGVLGVPTFRTSITPTNAHATPDAVREALMRYSTYSASHRMDIGPLLAFDFGDVVEPDGPLGEQTVRESVAEVASLCSFLVAIGGDNSLTYSVVSGLFGDRLAECGLITLDAHHDLRDGESNGSPVRRLIADGLPGSNIVQIGIGDFSNSPAYSQRASEAGITVVPRADLRGVDLAPGCELAVDIAGAGGRPVFLDIDLDVCDRAEVPGCPSAAPGGITADELRQLVFALCSDPRVAGIDLTEVDATADAPDGRTVRLAALLLLEAAAGVASRGLA